MLQGASNSWYGGLRIGDQTRYPYTLESLISVGPQINVAPGKFVKNNKRSHLNKRSPWKIQRKQQHYPCIPLQISSNKDYLFQYLSCNCCFFWFKAIEYTGFAISCPMCLKSIVSFRNLGNYWSKLISVAIPNKNVGPGKNFRN